MNEHVAIAQVYRRLLAAIRCPALLACSTRVLVDGNSMLPALADGDRLLVSRLGHRLGAPKRGDIVLLRDPSRPGYECIKRIVALPGDRVRLKGSSVTVSSQEFAADLLPAEGWHIAPGHYFVLGDNVTQSRDSRAFGPVPRELLLGAVWYRYASRSGATGLL